MAQTTSPVSKSSPRQKPMRAVLPITSVTKDVSRWNWKSENSSPLLWPPNLGWKNKTCRDTSGLRSPGALSCKGKSKDIYKDLLPLNQKMRRTASFDTVFLPSTCQGELFFHGCTTLCIDKATQTAECFDLKGKLKQDSISDEEKVEKFFRHRFQRKDSSNSSSFSGSTPTEHITTQTNPSVSYPLIIPDTPVHKHMIRSSVEGLNQEIERLVLRNTSLLNIEREEDRDISEGHRAPLAELLRLNTRSVDTQTPGDTFTPSSLSSGPPSRGDSDSPVIQRPVAFSRPTSGDSSPGDGDQGSKSGASPKINKFLAREPPDGCEKVNLKFNEDLRKPICDLSLLDYPPLKPSLNFTLKQSSGSAFYSLLSNNETNLDEPSGSKQGLDEDEVQK